MQCERLGIFGESKLAKANQLFNNNKTYKYYGCVKNKDFSILMDSHFNERMSAFYSIFNECLILFVMFLYWENVLWIVAGTYPINRYWIKPNKYINVYVPFCISTFCYDMTMSVDWKWIWSEIKGHRIGQVLWEGTQTWYK